jgi:hypothetical protein
VRRRPRGHRRGSRRCPEATAPPIAQPLFRKSRIHLGKRRFGAGIVAKALAIDWSVG